MDGRHRSQGRRGRVWRYLAGSSAVGAATAVAAFVAGASGPASAATVSSACADPSATPASPAAVKALPGGGTDYVYDIGGTTNHVPVPPPGFRPENATADQLDEYGFPPRPSDPTELSDWLKDMSQWKATSVPTVCNLPAVAAIGDPAEGEPSDPSAARRFYNWAGFYTRDSSDHWKSVKAEYNQPDNFADPCTDSWEVSWVGLGGVDSNSLLQDGTGMHNGKWAWYEYISPNNDSHIVQTTLSVSAGDHMHVETDYSPSGNKVTFFIQNQTTGGSRNVVVDGIGDAYYDGSHGDFIDERPTVSGSFAPLRNFDHVHWTNAKVETKAGDWNSLGSESHRRVEMIAQGNGTRLAEPDPLDTNTEFHDFWYHCNGQ